MIVTCLTLKFVIQVSWVIRITQTRLTPWRRHSLLQQGMCQGGKQPVATGHAHRGKPARVATRASRPTLFKGGKTARVATRVGRPTLFKDKGGRTGYPQMVRSGGGSLGGSELTGTPFWQSTCTNHRNRGRTSADRSTRATLMLTVPRSLIKSSTKDLT